MVKLPERYVLFHEVGHLVVGLKEGIIEQGIEFPINDPNCLAKAHYISNSLAAEQKVKRSVAGLACANYFCSGVRHPKSKGGDGIQHFHL